jgi:hypothetical protein
MFYIQKYKFPKNLNVTIKIFKNGLPYEGNLKFDDPNLFMTYPSEALVIDIYKKTLDKSSKLNKCFVIEVHQNEIKVVEVL